MHEPREHERADTLAVAAPVLRLARTTDRDVEAVVLHAYDAHQRALHAFARALVREPEAAEDLVAEAFMRLIAEVRAGRVPDDPKGWLFRVTTNLVLSRGRRLATARRFIGRLLDRRTGESPETGMLRREVDARLLTALAALPVDMRIAIVLAARGASGREIAVAIERTEAATRTLLTRARQRLRAELGEPRDRFAPSADSAASAAPSASAASAASTADPTAASTHEGAAR